jgi:TonB family protein
MNIAVLAIILLSQAPDITALRDSAVADVAAGNWHEALDKAKRGFVLAPDDLIMLGILKCAWMKNDIKKLNPKCFYKIDVKYGNGEIQDAWSRIIEKTPDNVHLLEFTATLFLESAPQQAFAYASGCSRRDSLNSRAYFIMGLVSEKGGNYAGAGEYYQRACTIDTTSADYLIALARMYLMQYMFDSVSRYLEKIPEDTTYESVHLFQAVCAAAHKEYDVALRIVHDMRQNGVHHSGWLEDLDRYLSNLKEGIAQPADTGRIPVTATYKSIPWLHMPQYVALVTCDSIALQSINLDYLLCEKKLVPLSVQKPVYPEEARKCNMTGDVLVRALVDTTGLVIDAEVWSSNVAPILEEAAMEAAMGSRFEPAKRFGRKVKVWVSVPIRFRLTE